MNNDSSLGLKLRNNTFIFVISRYVLLSDGMVITVTIRYK